MFLGAVVMKDTFTLLFDPHSCLWEGGIVTPLRNKDIETPGSWCVGDSNRAMPGLQFQLLQEALLHCSRVPPCPSALKAGTV